MKVYPWGLEGGLSAAGSRFDFGNGQTNLPGTVELNAGQVVELVTPGGGGYGPPSARSPDLVALDLKEEHITPEFAEGVYGFGATCTAPGMARP